MQGRYIIPADAKPDGAEFYDHAMAILREHGVPFLVGGAYAFQWYTGIAFQTKDMDVMVRPSDCGRVVELMSRAGYESKIVFHHWLAKVVSGRHFIDVIFNAGNGVVPVDDSWFQDACSGELWGTPVLFCSASDLIWSKAFVMERERFDGADVMHLLRTCAQCIDWQRLLDRFGMRWRVLLSHLVLFGFVYPAERAHIPSWVLRELICRIEHELDSPSTGDHICHGTLLSREQYLNDVLQWGYRDARLPPHGTMSEEEIKLWTAAIARD